MNSEDKQTNIRIIWIVLLAILIGLSAAYVAVPEFKTFMAGLMPLATSEPETLKNHYSNNDFRVLIIPGHDNVERGAEFGNLYEEDLNTELAQYLFEFFLSDDHFEVFTTRDLSNGDYTDTFSNYIESEESNITIFRSNAIDNMKNAVAAGQIQLRNGVPHNFASNRASIYLYGFNKWANENKIDLLIHVHFNDHSGRRRNDIGQYTGFSIYVPDSQYSSSKSSLEIANSIFGQLNNLFHVSTLPGENNGIVEDQELIAVGANGSLDGATLLIEYGYIYENPLSIDSIRGAYLKELAHQSYSGIKKYFEPMAQIDQTTLLPYEWNNELNKGSKESRDVLSLQTALVLENIYPPKGKSKSECPLTGIFGSCTEESVRSFQNKYGNEILESYGLSEGTGYVGSATTNKLNSLFGI